MAERIVIPYYAKESARAGLLARKNLISRKQSDQKSCPSVRTAVLLKDKETISVERARAIAEFYSRFNHCNTPFCRINLDLWGGRRFGHELYRKFYQ